VLSYLQKKIEFPTFSLGSSQTPITMMDPQLATTLVAISVELNNLPRISDNVNKTLDRIINKEIMTKFDSPILP